MSENFCYFDDYLRVQIMQVSAYQGSDQYLDVTLTLQDFISIQNLSKFFF